MAGNHDQSDNLSWDPLDLMEDLLLNDTEERCLELLKEIQRGNYLESSSSRPRKMTINRDHIAGHQRLLRDCFTEESVYYLETFRRRFRMQQHVFLRVVDSLSNLDPYIQ
ncbi:hypothetical protein CRG98_046283 [Punica granatum]|uniref:Uncharacterized protein n=1 Tax=Punica granatum TaxID=22663 RepID=A0A2I0HPX5_PUNGR|nr:hypothetical protein CRG98_046283 [Punica granatum]